MHRRELAFITLPCNNLRCAIFAFIKVCESFLRNLWQTMAFEAKESDMKIAFLDCLCRSCGAGLFMFVCNLLGEGEGGQSTR